MKIGIHTFAWEPRWSNETLYIIDFLKHADFDFVELPLMEVDHFDAKAVRERCEGVLEPVCSSTLPSSDMDLSSTDPAKRANGIAFLKKCMERTHACGGTLFSGMCYVFARKPYVPTEEEWDNCVQAMKQVAKYAAEFGITLGIEPANRFANHLLNTAEQGLKFIEDMGEPNVVLHLDSVHMCSEERSIRSALLRANGKLGYFHMNSNDRGRPGYDDLIDWDDVFETFKQIGFNGHVAFEGFCEGAGYIHRDIIGHADKFATLSLAFAHEMMRKHGFTRD